MTSENSISFQLVIFYPKNYKQPSPSNIFLNDVPVGSVPKLFITID